MSIPKPTSLFQSSSYTLIPPFPLWLYKYLAVFPVTGLLGLDHFALGSYFTGLSKSFINLITLGSWYAYDIVQVYNSKNLRENGLHVPFIEMGSIGKGKIDDEPASIMSKNTKLWIYILILSLFLGVYFITTIFISYETDWISRTNYIISNITFYGSIGLAVFILYYYLSAKTTNLFTSTATKTNAVTNLRESSGISQVGGPNNQVKSLLNASLLSQSMGPTKSFFSAYGGGATNELTNIAQEVMNGGAKESFQHIYFGLIIALIPISGFIIYTLRKYKKSSYEVSA